MPRMDRSQHLRQRPLGDQVNVLEFPVNDESGAKVYASPGYLMFLERMWHGDYQQIPIDPDELDDWIEALTQARDYANEGRVDASGYTRERPQ